MDCSGEVKTVNQLTQDFPGHEQRIPVGVHAIIRDATAAPIKISVF